MFCGSHKKQEIPTTSIRLITALQQEINGEHLYKLHREHLYQFDSETSLVLTLMVATIGQARADILQWLKNCLSFDLSPSVRQAAVQAITQSWKDDPDALLLLKDLAQHDPNTLPWLKHRAQQGDNWVVRGAALKAIAQSWKDDPDTLPWLKLCAQHSDKDHMRSAAATALVDGWKDDSQTFDLLCHIAMHDRFQRKYDFQDNPRQTVLEAILKNYPDRPEIIDLLRDRSINDADEKVQKFAEQELSKLISTD